LVGSRERGDAFKSMILRFNGGLAKARSRLREIADGEVGKIGKLGEIKPRFVVRVKRLNSLIIKNIPLRGGEMGDKEVK
jgi:hypothetical protein